MVDLRLGDCLEVLRTLPECSVDAIVTDPRPLADRGLNNGSGVLAQVRFPYLYDPNAKPF
jgi:DNA modification methylase